MSQKLRDALNSGAKAAATTALALLVSTEFASHHLSPTQLAAAMALAFAAKFLWKLLENHLPPTPPTLSLIHI